MSFHKDLIKVMRGALGRNLDISVGNEGYKLLKQIEQGVVFLPLNKTSFLGHSNQPN